MRRNYAYALAVSVLLAGLSFVPRLSAQTAATESPAKDSGAGWVWLEQFAGSANTYGQVTATTSSAGYNFNSHLGVIGGLPLYLIHNSSSTTTAPSSVHGIGDVFGSLRFAWAAPVVNYRMTLTGAAPSGDSSKGLGTGNATYDWTHHLDRGFGRWTPFAEGGLTNSTSQALLVQRQFVSSGPAAHFEAGSAFRLIGPVSVSASAYDIQPWATQTVLSRVVSQGGPSAGTGKNGRVFELSQKTVGGADLTRDYGFNAGVGVSISSVAQFWAGFNHSSHFALNTFSFGVGVNVLNLIHRGSE
jgi:hypothetical protein